MGRKLNRILEAALEQRAESLKPEWIGTQEYVYVKDAAQGLALAALTTTAPPGAYNIGIGRVHTYEDVLAEIRQALPAARIAVEPAGPTAPYLQRSQAFDLTRARQVLGYEPRFTFQQGLQDYLAELRAFAGQYARLD
jgi:nucleoside-diphosphate-sugar epimerase